MHAQDSRGDAMDAKCTQQNTTEQTRELSGIIIILTLTFSQIDTFRRVASRRVARGALGQPRDAAHFPRADRIPKSRGALLLR